MRLLLTGLIFALATTFGQPASALVTAELTLDNNGVVIGDPNQIVDVTADDSSAPAPFWSVTYDQGLNFEQAFFNYDQPLGAGDVVLTGSSVGLWSLDTNGATAGNFGQFSFALGGPVAPGLAALTFDILVDGVFIPNSKGNLFAAKISSEQGGNAGGFVSHGSISTIPLPGAVWLFLSALAGLGIMSRRHIHSNRQGQA